MKAKNTDKVQDVKNQTRVEDSTPADNFTQRVESARQKAGLKKYELEVRAGLPKGYASRLTGGGAGSVRPTAAMIRKLAAVLQVTPEWLETGAGAERATGGAASTEARPNLDRAATTLHGTIPASVVADVRAAMSIFHDLEFATWICVLTDVARSRRDE
jgi:transcriptional regulator with XRE-family HTH domain